jgi:hypothetical protein
MEIYVFDDHCSLKDDRFKYNVVSVVFMFIGIVASAYCICVSCLVGTNSNYDSGDSRIRELTAHKMQLGISTPTNTNRTVPESSIANRIVPESSIANRIVPESSIANRIVPESNIANRIVPESSIAKRIVPESSIANRIVPESNIRVVQIKALEDTKDPRNQHFYNIVL